MPLKAQVEFTCAAHVYLFRRCSFQVISKLRGTSTYFRAQGVSPSTRTLPMSFRALARYEIHCCKNVNSKKRWTVRRAYRNSDKCQNSYNYEIVRAPFAAESTPVAATRVSKACITNGVLQSIHFLDPFGGSFSAVSKPNFAIKYSLYSFE